MLTATYTKWPGMGLSGGFFRSVDFRAPCFFSRIKQLPQVIPGFGSNALISVIKVSRTGFCFAPEDAR